MASFLFTVNELLSSLERATREDGSSYWRRSASAPDWTQNVIREAHCGELPNDSRYELIRDCLEALRDNCCESPEEAQELSHEISLELLPIYTGELLSWFSELPSRLGDCDEAVACDRVSELSTYGLLSEGFRMAAEETLSSLASSIEEARFLVFDPATDCRLLLSDSHGIYIPQFYCQNLSEEDGEEMGVSRRDVLLCCCGPNDNELYWEAWERILNAAEWEEDGETWRLLQNGDLWQVRADVEIPEGF